MQVIGGVSMEGGQKADAAVSGLLHGGQVPGLGDLVNGNDLRIGRAQEHGDSHRLGTGIHYIRVAAHFHLGLALQHHRHLPPFVHQGDPVGRKSVGAIG